ncbi:MAG TPA: hypothetical protein VK797_04695 [Tepidisphaeraceae bacterium]|jgi:hypothetical protein|nr:hypothetical protein [Tepidisphaeraceae bacterium]
MTVQLTLPRTVLERLLAEVKAGRHASVEEAILERLSRTDDASDLLTAAGMDASQLRRDLDDAWNNRQGVVDGEEVFARIAEKSRNAQGK